MSESNAIEKPGYKTSEYWLSLAVVILGALASAGLFEEGHWGLKAIGLAISALAAMGYSAARAKTKLGASMERSSLGKPASE